MCLKAAFVFASRATIHQHLPASCHSSHTSLVAPRLASFAEAPLVLALGRGRGALRLRRCAMAGSSSGGIDVVVAGDSPSNGDSPSKGGFPKPVILATPRRTSDIIFADVVGADTIVTNVVTHERHVLPGNWVKITEDDDCMIFQEEGPDDEGLRDPDVLFQRSVLVQEETQEVWISERKADTFNYYTLDSIASRQRSAEVELKLGACAAKETINVAVFVRARSCNQRVFWQLQYFFKMLRLESTHGGVASKWVDKGQERWASWLKDTVGFGDGHIIYSTFLSPYTTKRSSLPFRERCLDSSSISTCGLMLLGARWASIPKNQGGLATLQSRHAASALVDTLIGWTSGVDAFKLIIELAPGVGWTCRWPRPPQYTSGHNVLEVTVAGGKIDLTAFQTFLQTDDCTGVARHVCAAVAVLVPIADNDYPLSQFLFRTVTTKAVLHVAAQVCMQLSVRLEKLMGDSVVKNLQLPGITFKWKELTNNAIEGNGLGKILAQYISACRQESKASVVLGMPTDKASVCGLPLQVSTVIMPNNVALLCCPQAFK